MKTKRKEAVGGFCLKTARRSENAMRTLYYYVPPCPVCGSEVTGRYVTPPLVNRKYMMMESLKNGEIIKFRKKLPDKNMFCESCGFEWHEDVRPVWIEAEDKEGEIARRKTERRLLDYMRENNIDPDRKKFLGGMFSGLIDFF